MVDSRKKERGMSYTVYLITGGCFCVETTSRITAQVMAENQGFIVENVEVATDAQIGHFAFLDTLGLMHPELEEMLQMASQECLGG